MKFNQVQIEKPWFGLIINQDGTKNRFLARDVIDMP